MVRRHYCNGSGEGPVTFRNGKCREWPEGRSMWDYEYRRGTKSYALGESSQLEEVQQAIF